MSARTISIVMPALNEERNLQGAIDSVVAAAERTFDGYELIVVDDGSTDGTPDLVRANTTRNPRIRVVRHDRPWGFGASYDDGRRRAAMTHCVMVHGDDPCGVESLSAFFSHAGATDVVAGYIENPESRSRGRRAISAVYTALLNRMLGLDLRYYNGLQIHRTDWLRAVRLSSTGFGFQAELLIKAVADGLTVRQAPYRHRERPGGGVTKIFRPRNVLSVAGTLARFWAGEERSRILKEGRFRLVERDARL